MMYPTSTAVFFSEKVLLWLAARRRRINNMYSSIAANHACEDVVYLLNIRDDVNTLLLAQYTLPRPEQVAVVGVLELDRSLLERERG